jgi:WD40 repeat protein
VLLPIGLVAIASVLLFGLHLKQNYDLANVPAARCIVPRPHTQWQQGIQALSFSPDSALLAVSDCQLNVDYLNVPELSPSKTVPSQSGVDAESLAWTPDGKQVIEGGPYGSGYCGIRLWNCDNQTSTPVLGRKLGIEAVERHPFAPLCELSPSGKLVATGLDNTNLQIYNVTTSKTLQLSLPDIYHSTRMDDVQVFAFREPKPLQQLALPTVDPIMSMAFSKDSGTLAVGYVQYLPTFPFTQGIVCLYDTNTGRLTRLLGLNPDGISQVSQSDLALAFLPDGSALAIADEKSVLLWNTATGTSVKAMDRNTTFNPQHKSLVVIPGRPRVAGIIGSDVVVWNTLNGKQVQVFHGSDIHTSLAVSPDGKYLATGGENDKGNGVVDIWPCSFN